MTAGANPIGIRRGIEAAVTTAVEALKAQANPVSNKEEIAQVEPCLHVLKKLVSTFQKLWSAWEQMVLLPVEESRGMETELDVVEGMQFDRGYLSQYMVTDNEKMVAELENPFILITDQENFSY